jgi:predicted Kef-type K+ transport protein
LGTLGLGLILIVFSILPHFKYKTVIKKQCVARALAKALNCMSVGGALDWIRLNTIEQKQLFPTLTNDRI